jgi:hypothetical protein
VAFSERFFFASGQQRIRAVLIQNAIIALVLGALVIIFALQKRAQKFLEAKSEELAAANQELRTKSTSARCWNKTSANPVMKQGLPTR